MKYAYPVIFTYEDGKVLVNIPDLTSINTFGDDVADAIYMAEDAMAMWLWDAENKNEEIPAASQLSDIAKDLDSSRQFASMVACDTDEYNKQVNTKAVIKSVSIPEWLDYRARQANAPLSQIFQQGLKAYLHIPD